MNPKKAFLIQVLEKNNQRHQKGSLPKLEYRHFHNSKHAEMVFEVYKELGGLGSEIPFFLTEWDIELEGIGIMLDDELNFNRYRAITLRSTFYQDMSGFPLEPYKRFCRMYEEECLKSGSFGERWSNSISEKYFGPSDEKGDLGVKGASAWKLKAFQDYLLDISSSVLKIKLIRISIYDNLMIDKKMITLNNLLISKVLYNENYLWKYISRKI